MANSAKLYQTILAGLEYRGTAFFQSYTSCQPEHGVADDMSAQQAKLARDSRGMPEFVFDPQGGEMTTECFLLKGNPNLDRDWWQATYASDNTKYNYTVAHWATTEARFRKHLKIINGAEATESIHLDDILPLITQDDVVHRRIFDETHRSYIPDFGVYIKAEVGGKERLIQISRQTVLFCIERRKAWRMLQSRAGQVNKDYLAQKSLLKKIDAGDISVENFRPPPERLMQQSWKRYEIVVFGDHGSCLTPCESKNCRQAVSRSALRAFYFVEGTAKAIQEFIEINAV